MTSHTVVSVLAAASASLIAFVVVAVSAAADLPTHRARVGLVTVPPPPLPSSSSSPPSPGGGAHLQQVLYAPRGLAARLDCPVDANPPVTLVVWWKNDRVLDVTKSTRFNVNSRGTLVVSPVSTGDDGRYACTPYSPLGAGETSNPVQLVVRGRCL